MATWKQALQDLNEGCTTWRAAWDGENDFLEADHGEEAENSQEWLAGEEPFGITRETDGEIEPFEPTEEDKNATDWAED
jgi:hypothetical protein